MDAGKKPDRAVGMVDCPYGYYLENNQLLIEETEAKAIRIIFEKLVILILDLVEWRNILIFKALKRYHARMENWKLGAAIFIRQILDNPVYCGKIAYGRRTREKSKKELKNEYKQVHTDDYILEDGQHEGIVSAELWEKVVQNVSPQELNSHQRLVKTGRIF